MNNHHLAGIIFESAQTYANKVAMRIKIDGQWQSYTYQEMGDAVRQIARALLALGVQPGDRVGIFAENRPEWALVDFAVLAVGGVSVPIYATNTRNEAAYIVEETDMAIIFTGGQNNYDKAQSIIATSTSLKHIIALDEQTEISGERSQHFSRFRALGTDQATNNEIEARLAAGAEDLATIIYTSGTTGEPKGVMLTHANIFHQFKALEA